MTGKKQLTALPNVFIPSQRELPKDFVINKEVQYEDIEKMILVYHKEEFRTQQEKNENKEVMESGIFYVQKIDKIFDKDAFYNYAAAYPGKKFLILSENRSCAEDIRVFLDIKKDVIKAHFFSNYQKNGHLKEIGSVRNVYGEGVWDENTLKTVKECRIDIPTIQNHNGACYYGDKSIYINGIRKNSELQIFNREYFGASYRDNNRCSSLGDIMNRYVELSDNTRLHNRADNLDNSLVYSLLTGEETSKKMSLSERYGIAAGTRTWGTNNCVESEVSQIADLDDSTKERVSKYIRESLEQEDGCDRLNNIDYYAATLTRALTKVVLVISKPIQGHRRQTYHLFQGIKNGGAIDVLEVARGELNLKDLSVENCYYLTKKGEFCGIHNRMFRDFRANLIPMAEVDPITFARWSEEESLYPKLMSTITECGADKKIGLYRIRIFNRLKFGALFTEQLIKDGKENLAVQLAEEIVAHGDKMRDGYSSMDDILPGCNPNGTTILKQLNMSKPCYDLLFSEKSCRESLTCMRQRYKIIKKFIPDNVPTKEKMKMIEMYTELDHSYKSRYSCAVTNTTEDIINYPEDIKSIYKMQHRLKDVFQKTEYYDDMERRYEEIVKAYYTIKRMGESTDHYKVFIEFSLAGDDIQEVVKMISDRERAANVATDILKAKVNEALYRKTEAQYASRKKALKKLETAKDINVKLTGAGFFDYEVLMPSQIYGKATVGSLEKEGEDMRHCVFRSYAKQVAEGTYTVMYLRQKHKPEESLVTIGINKDGRINQTYGKNDSIIEQQEAKAIYQWAQSKKGLVTFSTELYNVAPGGWPSGFPVPDLPKPDEKWLSRLAKVSESGIIEEEEEGGE